MKPTPQKDDINLGDAIGYQVNSSVAISLASMKFIVSFFSLPLLACTSLEPQFHWTWMRYTSIVFRARIHCCCLYYCFLSQSCEVLQKVQVCFPCLMRVLPEKLSGGVRPVSQNPYPISDQNLQFSLPYFRPDQKFNALFQT